MDRPTAALPQLTTGELLALLRPQLADLIDTVEQHGVELGMICEALLGLIERHQAEAARHESSAEAAHAFHEQLLADHQTMLAFGSPLNILRQFYDRLRQRLEHIDQVVQKLPAAPLAGTEVFSQAVALFPLDEERAISAHACGIEDKESREPSVELFE
jgi:hypothetical protein